MSAIKVEGLDKNYGGVIALDGMSLDVETSSIHAVVGENGAGKSTLMKILAGVTDADAGVIYLDGDRVKIDSPREAREHGIDIVHQELRIFPDRPTLANLFANNEPTRAGFVSEAEMERRARPMLDRLGLDVDLHLPVGQLTVGEQQLVELARVLIERPRILILDEPNSALNEAETQRLFAVLRDLSDDAITILYVSHRLEEVFEICDAVTVMRDGKHVLDGSTSELTIHEVVTAMTGEAQETAFPERATEVGDDMGPGLVVEDLSVGGKLRDVSFVARPGEIVGLAGLEGAGIGLLLGALFGTRHATTSAVRFPDGHGLPQSPTGAARRRVSLVPADRKSQGLMLERSVEGNVAQVGIGALRSRNPWLPSRKMARAAERQVRSLAIKTPDVTTPVNQLSGGNQQKVVIAKWLEVAPDVVLLDDPTRGVDVGAKREIYALIRGLARSGRILLFRSTELPELVGLADRILVFYRGRLTADRAANEVDEASLLHAINTGSFATEDVG